MKAAPEQHVERPGQCPFHAGMHNHVGPYGDPSGVIVATTSDNMFGPEGLGFAKTPWMKLVSWLARSGISEQTGSKPNETIVKNCVLGWGQGAFSSHVFQADGSIDRTRLERLIKHLGDLAATIEGDRARITAPVVAAFVNSQPAQPYRTIDGLREVTSLRDRLSSRFRGHIQWQSLVTLCGQTRGDGTRVLTGLLLRTFFGGERSFFLDLVERRRQLRSGQLTPGEQVGLLLEVEDGIDRVRTDRAYLARKSSLRVVLRILFYMFTRKGAKSAPL